MQKPNNIFLERCLDEGISVLSVKRFLELQPASNMGLRHSLHSVLAWAAAYTYYEVQL